MLLLFYSFFIVNWRREIVLFLVFCLPLLTFGQKDTAQKKITIDSFLLKQPGILGNLAQNLFADTTEENGPDLQAQDKRFRKFEGKVIRRIDVEVLEFGTPITDTAKSIKNTLTRLGDYFHHNTRGYVIRKNLFFHKGDRLNPFLLADNERHLRDLDFNQDARITVKPVRYRSDSVDVTVLVKDVLSLGGRFHLHNTGSATVQAREDNLAGWGDRLLLGAHFDQKRYEKFGWGGEYGARNIGGSFIDATAGRSNFEDAFNSGRREEAATYLQLVKPLVHPYMKWTYALEASSHETRNLYTDDSLYQSDYHYKYSNFDAWAGWNVSADVPGKKNADNRLRRLIAFRYLHRNFQQAPQKYSSQYMYRYSDLTGLLGAVSLFRQNTIKTRYIYGFGRTEDVPEGRDLTVTGGYTKRAGRARPYADVKYQWNGFTPRKDYVNLTARAGGYLYAGHPQDLGVLFHLDYFTRLHQLSARWKERSFLGLGLARQFNEELEEPLYLDSPFGLQEYRNNMEVYGNTRATLKAESVFYSPWRPLLFQVAPFVFGNLTYLHPAPEVVPQRKIYSSLGAGIRTRNESLVFGTIELKGYYFPGGNHYNQTWHLALNTNVKFKYNRQLIKRPELLSVN
ncbi:hypothetical protein V9K67_16425 [Paraflavisolibacter sp. H34]|uniref:hypothetical protein n=1 Tax=Huijunlia imazamoxiresistens TaxID=3127457 RepID=UPI003015A671